MSPCNYALFMKGCIPAASKMSGQSHFSKTHSGDWSHGIHIHGKQISCLDLFLNVFTGHWNESQNISMQIKMSRTNKLSANGQVRSMLPNERGKYKVVFLTVLLMEGQDRCWWKHHVCRQEENDELHMRLIFISRYWWRTPWWNINVQSFRSWLIDWWRNVVLDTLRLRCTENGINLQAPYRV